nr:hypothetical protein BaRGS_016744 [Batillaria attramentaria]
MPAVFEDALRRSLAYIRGFNRLATEVENRRKIKYSAENSEHEAKLLRLWTLYMGDRPLESRICDQWTELGFQGKDPMTDFRGMGILGLEQLL